MKKRILLISENDIVYNQTQRVLSEQYILSIFSFGECGNRLSLLYDMIIIDFDQLKVEEKMFKAILDIRCKSQAPILALLENSSILDRFEVLSMGALDFIELPVTDEEYVHKLRQLYKWNWYYDWKNTNS